MEEAYAVVEEILSEFYELESREDINDEGKIYFIHGYIQSMADGIRSKMLKEKVKGV